ncbi:MAG: flavodoxin [Chloroflexota bacterium]|nr:flavodoxin [Chloroflexota bacterium]
MAKIGLIYGSNTGNTEFVAEQLKNEFEKIRPGSIDMHNIGQSTPDTLLKYDYLVLGVPTWNTGQMQDDWEAFLPKLAAIDLSGKKVAMFGLGDQNGYGYNFLDALGMLADAFMDRGAQLWGMWSTKSYEYAESKANVEDFFLGLGVDQDGQKDMTSDRLAKWANQVVKQFGV